MKRFTDSDLYEMARLVAMRKRKAEPMRISWVRFKINLKSAVKESTLPGYLKKRAINLIEHGQIKEAA